MIQVKIATSVSEAGVGDVRWVLVDPSEVPPPPEDATLDTDPAQDTPPEARRTARLLRVMQALVLLAALAGAWWVSSSLIPTHGTGVPVPSLPR